MLAHVAAGASTTGDSREWFDRYYQYRLSLSATMDKAGWCVIPIDEAAITSKVNAIEELAFDPLFFAYNQLRVVETDRDGRPIDSEAEAGFHIVPLSANLVTQRITGKEQVVEIPTERGAYYLVEYRAKGGGKSPVLTYEQIFPVGSELRKHGYMSSYEPALLPKKLTSRRCLLISDGRPMSVRIKDQWVTGVKSISVRKVRIVFLVKADEPGPKHWTLYYQPMCAWYLTVPQRRRVRMPARQATAVTLGPAEKFVGRTKHPVSANARARIWFAETTVKITPTTPVPGGAPRPVRISCAKNEAQSFHLVIRPQAPFEIAGVQASDLEADQGSISADHVTVEVADYVPIRKRSLITPATRMGKIADPLVPVESTALDPACGNHVLWVTVRTPAGTAAGEYMGTIAIEGDGYRDQIPLVLEVYDFELPEYSTFQSGLGGQFYPLSCRGGKKGFDYHGLETESQRRELLLRTYDVMARNKFTPKNVSLASAIPKWSPPPAGYDIDEPGNFFRLHDWNFSEVNRNLEHYIDELKVNSVLFQATDPRVSNLCTSLPGGIFAWGKREGDPYYDQSVQISRAQFDRLTLDHYGAMARNLEAHGWLDHFYFFVDEGTDIERILHLMRLFKSDPLLARIRFVACVQGFEYLTDKEQKNDDGYAFEGLLTYLPQIDENYNRWEDHFFEDYHVPRDRSRLWFYAVTTSRMTIDTPGINNRVLGLDIFQRGGSGFYVWETIIYDPGTSGASGNPWADPYCSWGNGAAMYFYPPRRDGFAEQPDLTVTPSLRIMTYREGVDDYEYAQILEDLIAAGKSTGIDVEEGKDIMRDIDRFFYNSVHWSQNDAWYLDLRDRMARCIEKLARLTERFHGGNGS